MFTSLREGHDGFARLPATCAMCVLMVGVLLVCPAQATVIHSGPINTTVVANGSYGLIRPGESVADFTLTAYGPNGYEWFVKLSPASANQIAGTSQAGYQTLATAFPAGDTFGSSSGWLTAGQFGYLFYHSFFGYEHNWPNGGARYAGLVLNLPDGPHYGWAQVSTSFVDPISFTLVDWAYESTPNMAIQAGALPEPAPLALVLLGGLFLARRGRFAH